MTIKEQIDNKFNQIDSDISDIENDITQIKTSANTVVDKLNIIKSELVDTELLIDQLEEPTIEEPEEPEPYFNLFGLDVSTNVSIAFIGDVIKILKSKSQNLTIDVYPEIENIVRPVNFKITGTNFEHNENSPPYHMNGDNIPVPQFKEVGEYEVKISDGLREKTITIIIEDDTTEEPEIIPETEKPVDPRMMMDDMENMSDHMAVLNLVKYADVTHWPRQNGNWSDKHTWSGGRIPEDGARVIIPIGFEIIYDHQDVSRLKSVLVDGNLEIANDINTEMHVETLVVGPSGMNVPGGEFTADISNNDVTCRIVILDEGPLDIETDPILIGRGFISHGILFLSGAYKTPHPVIANDLSAGETSLTVKENLVGWEVGDQIVVAATEFGEVTDLENHMRTYDSREDVATITDINGRTIEFSPALKYDHKLPEETEIDFEFHVANFTRNIKIESESEVNRGHTMFMKSTTPIHCESVEFKNLGRSDKSIRSRNIGEVEFTPDTNVKGRYALHLHQTGFDFTDVLIRNAIWTSPGWGITHHDCKANLIENDVYNCWGAGIVSENGNEAGDWENNFVCRCVGLGGIQKNLEDFDEFDFGRKGNCYWLQSRNIRLKNNIANASPGEGYTWLARSPRSIWENFPHRVEDLEFIEVSRTRGYGDGTARNAEVPIRGFEDNVGYALDVPLSVVKAAHEQLHDVRTVMDGFKAFEINNGVDFSYTGHYTVIGFKLKLTKAREEYWKLKHSIGKDVQGVSGINFGGTSVDMALIDCRTEGFKYGANSSKKLPGGVDTSELQFHHVFHNLEAPDSIELVRQFDPNRDIFINGDITDFTNSVEVLNEKPIEFPFDGGQFELEINITDRYGTRKFGPDEFGDTYGVKSSLWATIHNGVWQYPDGRYVYKWNEHYTKDRMTGEIDSIEIHAIVPSNYKPADKKQNGVIDVPQ